MKASVYLSLLVFTIQNLQPATTSNQCNLYPKILGGALSDTYTTSIDANLAADRIVVAGYTSDSGLAGVSLNGVTAIFVASYSITFTSIYWTKADTSKNGLIPVSISLSPNANFAAMLINNYSGSSVGFIQVYDCTVGTLIT